MAQRPTGNPQKKICHMFISPKESIKAENYFSAESMVIL